MSTEEAQFGGVERYELWLKAAHMPQIFFFFFLKRIERQVGT